MLTAAVIEIEAVQEGNLEGASGAAVHGFWLNHWRSVDADYAALLHEGQDVQPFTLSPLLGLPFPRRGELHIQPGQTAWFRVTSLTATLSQKLIEEWLPRLPAEIPIGGLRWRPIRSLYDHAGHPWAGQASVQALADHCLLSGQPETRWSLHFETPTAFKIDKRISLPFPMPGALVGSWLRRWQAYGPVSFDDPLKQSLLSGLAVCAYELKTIPARLKSRVEIGCVGDFSLTSVGLIPGECRVVDLLCAFAFWAGSGHHTTQGLGMTCSLTGKSGRYGKTVRSRA